MEWLLIINIVLWVSTSGLIGTGIWKVIKARQLLNKAKWSDYAEKYEGYLDTTKKQRERFMDIIKTYEKLLKNYETLEDIKGINEITTKLKELTKSLKAHHDHELALHTSLLGFARKGGVAGFSTTNQIEGTREIAIAAAFFAGSTVSLAISGILIALFY